MRALSNSRLFCMSMLVLAACVGQGAGALEPIPPPPHVKAPPSDALKTESGLAYQVIVDGFGATPVLSDRVKVHYTGWTSDGAMFDSSLARGPMAVFAVDAVIAGWTEGLQLMKEGGQYRLWIPESLAYQGESDKPEGMLVFDIELIKVNPDP